MTREQFDKLMPGEAVTVFSFGRHAGVIMQKNPTLTIQGRTFEAAGWVKVRLFRGPEWNGTFEDVDVTKRIAPPKTVVPSPKRKAFG